MASSGCVPEEDTQNSQLQECETEEKIGQRLMHNLKPKTMGIAMSTTLIIPNFGLERP